MGHGRPFGHPAQEPEDPDEEQDQDHEEVEQGHEFRAPMFGHVAVPSSSGGGWVFSAVGVEGVVDQRQGGLALVVRGR